MNPIIIMPNDFYTYACRFLATSQDRQALRRALNKTAAIFVIENGGKRRIHFVSFIDREWTTRENDVTLAITDIVNNDVDSFLAYLQEKTQ